MQQQPTHLQRQATPNSKDKTIQIEPIAPKTKQPAKPSPITDSENFENINKEELPMIGDV